MTRRAVLAFLLLLPYPALARAEVLYQVIDLGMGFAGIPQDLNASGQTAGHHGISFALGTTAVTWDAAGTRTILPTLGGPHAYAMGINDAGLIVGAAKAGPGENYLATVWSGGVASPLPSPAPYSAALAVNSSGQIAGYINNAGAVVAYTTDGVLSQGNRAAAWVGGQLIDLGLPGENQSTAFAINKAGTVVGRSQTGTQTNAVVWSGGAATVLNGLGGNFSTAYAINDAGLIAGASRTAGGEVLAVIWNGDLPTILGALAGQTRSMANDINNAGLVVGSITVGTQDRAVLWTPDGPIDLNSVIVPLTGIPHDGMVLTEALAINDAGVIAVMGSTPSPFAATRPYLLVPLTTPIPEPSTLALLSVGAVLLGWRVRRRRLPGRQESPHVLFNHC